MNKKFLSAILFGALMVTSTGTFVSCSDDYDDDIKNLQEQITTNANAIKALQDLISQGNWVTGVTATDGGIRVTMSNGSTTDIQSVKGADGADGKDGTVVTIVDGYWAFDGVKSEYLATPGSSSNGQDAHEIKVEDGYWSIWNSEKGAYEKTPYAVAPVSATENADGSWTIIVKNTNGGEDKITLPATGLTSIEVDNQNAEVNAMYYYYGILNDNVQWGWNKEETMGAGFYSKLSSDVRVLLNPAGVKGDAYNYTLKNSDGKEAPVKFFKTAKPYDGPALTRATSSNGLWVLPANIEKNDASKIEELRRDLYLSFKVNDGREYRLALEASDSQGNIVRSEYTNTVTLEQADATSSSWVAFTTEYYNLVRTTYYPVLEEMWGAGSQVYAYKIRVNQDPTNLRNAAVYGVKITDDEQGYYAENEAAVYNGIWFDICGIYLNGKTFTKTNAFSVYFTNEMTNNAGWTLDNFGKRALDAKEVSRADVPYIAGQVAAGHKIFEFTYTKDLTEQVASLSETEKLVWDQAIQRGTIYSYRDNTELYREGLIGGEGEYNSTNVNYVLNRHMTWSINPSNATENPNLLTVKFYVSDGWDWWTVANDNFKLKTAYQLTLYVVDPQNATGNVARIVLPFEFTQPTLDIARVNGKFTEWNEDQTVLYAYGHLCNASDDEMRLPLYDSFTAWQAKNGTSVLGDYDKYKSNAGYYELRFEPLMRTTIFGKSAGRLETVALDNALNYSAVDHDLNTMAEWKILNQAANAVDPVTGAPDPAEVEVPIAVNYNFYGVYPAEQKDFTLIFASWLKESTLAVTKDSYTTDRGTHQVLLTNDDIDFKTPKGGAFYLFDDLDGTNAATRSVINGDTFNEVNHYPFSGFSATSVPYGSNAITGLFDAGDNHFSAVQAGDMRTSVDVVPNVLPTANILIDYTTGKRYIDPSAVLPDREKITVYLVPSVSQNPDPAVVTDGIAKAFRGGMLVVLPQNYNEQDAAVITVTLKDIWGYENSFSFKVSKL